MKVCLIHNSYVDAGGEDAVFHAEAEALRGAGIDVITDTVRNEAYRGVRAAGTAVRSVWSRSYARRLGVLLAAERPDICHFHNTFPLVSPSAYYACRSAGIPVVQTLHNYRLMCAGATLFRDGRHCTDCLASRVPWPAVYHRCYHGSALHTTAVAATHTFHGAIGTWQKLVDLYITPSAAAKRLFAKGGLPATRIVVKPNFLSSDPGAGAHAGGYCLFVGRLSPEKGLNTLLDAWRHFRPALPLKIVGTGPLLEAGAPSVPGVEWLGWRDKAEVYSLLRDAAALLVPSEWPETFGLTIVEAFASACPVITTKLGSQGDLVRHGINGLHFGISDARGLSRAVDAVCSSASVIRTLGRAGRLEYETRFTRDAHLGAILQIYRSVVRREAPVGALPENC